MFKFNKYLNEGFGDNEDKTSSLDKYSDHTWIFIDIINENITAIAVDPRNFFERAEILDQLQIKVSELTLSTIEEFIFGFKDPLLVGFDIERKQIPGFDSIPRFDISFVAKNRLINTNNINKIMETIKNLITS